MLCQGGEGRYVERARVFEVYALTIWATGNDGLVGWVHVGHGGSSCKKVTCCTRVKDGPCSYGSHVDIDSFEECSCSKHVFWVGGKARLR
jgi:hypothetical protein